MYNLTEHTRSVPYDHPLCYEAANYTFATNACLIADLRPVDYEGVAAKGYLAFDDTEVVDNRLFVNYAP